MDAEHAGQITDVAAVAALADPTRRALYAAVVDAGEPLGRDGAAAAVGVSRALAAFHLDRLVADGLLETEFRRLSGRTGPGAGRPSKLYRRSPRQLSVSLPERDYELAGDVLAAAVETAVRDDVGIAQAVTDVARDAGRRIGEAGRAAGSEGDGLAATAQVLAGQGYEPRTSEDSVALANCPFDRLAADHTELVCTMNLALLRGVLEGL